MDLFNIETYDQELWCPNICYKYGNVDSVMPNNAHQTPILVSKSLVYSIPSLVWFTSLTCSTFISILIL